jgi:hypothetical protein
MHNKYVGIFNSFPRGRAFSVGWSQGGQMSLLQNRPKTWPNPFFAKFITCVTFTADKSSQFFTFI